MKVRGQRFKYQKDEKYTEVIEKYKKDVSNATEINEELIKNEILYFRKFRSKEGDESKITGRKAS